MDKCSRHDIPPAVNGTSPQQGHVLVLGLEALGFTVLTCRRLSLTSLTY